MNRLIFLGTGMRWVFRVCIVIVSYVRRPARQGQM